jgi:hypothetical protein
MANNLLSRREVLAIAGAAGLTALAGKALAGPPLSAYAKSVLASKPVAYWRLGEEKAPTSHDATAHKHHGKYVGQPLLGQPGAILADPDKAIGLDGPKSKSCVEVPDSTAFSVPTSGKGLTVEVWMRPDALDFPGENQGPKNPYIHWLGKGERGDYEWGLRFYSDLAQGRNRISAYIWNPDGGEIGQGGGWSGGVPNDHGYR